jgi:hypothetical protein
MTGRQETTNRQTDRETGQILDRQDKETGQILDRQDRETGYILDRQDRQTGDRQTDRETGQILERQDRETGQILDRQDRETGQILDRQNIHEVGLEKACSCRMARQAGTKAVKSVLSTYLSKTNKYKHRQKHKQNAENM